MKYKPHDESGIIRKQDYTKRIIFSLNDFVEKGHMLQVVTIPAKTKQRTHVHKKQTEVYYVLEGYVSIFINGREYEVKPGDAFIVSPGDKHSVWNKLNKEYKQVVFKIQMPEHEDTEWLE